MSQKRLLNLHPEVQSREILTESEETEIKEEHHEAAMVELRAEENQSEKCEEASNLQLDETEKALESASKVQSREILTESEEAKIKEEHHKAATAKLRAEENQPEKYEEASNLQLDETEKALEFVTKVQNDETLTKSEETEIKEEHHEATMAELRAEEKQSEECEEASNVKLDKTEKPLQSPSEVQSSEILTESKETKIKEEHHDAATAKLRAEENQSEKCEEASNLELDKTEKALESESEVQSDEILTESEEAAIKEEHHEPTTAELRAEENWSEKCEEASNLELDKTEKALESASKVQSDEIFTKSQEIDIKEEHHEAATAELSAEENQTEANEIVKNEVSNEELSDEIEKTSASRNIIKQTTHEDRALGDPYLVSVWDETLKESFPDEAEEKNVEEAEIKLNLENQGDTTNLRDSKTAATTLSEEVIIELEKRDLDTLGTDDKKETAITKIEEGPNTNLGVPPDTNAAAEEVPHERVGDESEKASEPYPTELVHETNIIHKEDEEIATAVADNQESIMEDQKQEHTSLALSRDGTNVKEDLKLKGEEVYDIKSGTSSANKISQEEIPDKNSTITEDEKQHDLVFDEETAAELGIPAEGKGIKDEREHAKNEEPKEVSTRENESKPDEVEIHSTTCANEDTEIQYQSQKPDDLAHIQDSGLVMSPKEGSVVLAEAIVTSQDIPTLEKNSPSISEKQILRETDPSEITETMVSTGNKDALLVVQDPEGKTSQKAEVKGLEPENASEIESEWNEETSKESTPMDAAKISLSNLQQRSTKETLQTAGQVTEEKEPMSNKELQTEEVETLQVEATKTNEEKDEEEEGDEHKKEDSGSDAPVMVGSL
ncbi:hypothetical protein L1049_003194 [Liquidambar formosana]|uniref:Uncharacterized protein n=1 Tax=Liquidambar formosana TaxID=63359 RepID=A0AAP0NIS9_LIQFO